MSSSPEIVVEAGAGNLNQIQNATPIRWWRHAMRRRGFAVVLLALLSCVILLERLRTYDEPLERDLTSYAIFAHEMLGGRRLYADLWDHKPPAIHVSYAIAEMIAGYGDGAMYLMGASMSIVTLLGIFAAAKKLAGPVGGTMAAMCWTMVNGDLYLQANQPNVEVFMNATLAWGVALGLRPRSWAAAVGCGACFALAVAYKQVALAPAMALFAAQMLCGYDGAGRKRIAMNCAIALGMIIGLWGAIFLYFKVSGDYDAFYSAVVGYNRDYATQIPANFLKVLRVIPPWPPAGVVWFPLAITTLGYLCIRDSKEARWWSPRFGDLLIVLLLGAVYLAIIAPRQGYPHYFQLWLPWLCIGSGLTAAALFARWPRIAWSVAGALAISLICIELPAYRLDAAGWARKKYGGDEFVETRDVGRLLGKQLLPRESFYQFGSATSLYYYARRSPPTGVIYAYPLFSGAFGDALAKRSAYQLLGTQPDMVVIDGWMFGNGIPANCAVVEWMLPRYVIIPGAERLGRFTILVKKDSDLLRRIQAARPAAS